MCRECGLLRGAGNHRRSRSEGTYQGCRARPSLELPDETPPPTPSPQRRGGASQTRLFFSPSPVRGGGGGEGFSTEHSWVGFIPSGVGAAWAECGCKC